MATPGPRRRLVFFVIALLLPSVMLLGFGIVLLMQDAELEARRAQDRRALVAREWTDSLFQSLEEAYVSAQTTGARHYANSALLDLGHFENGVARLPGTAPTTSPLLDRPFTDFLMRTTRTERADKRPLEAARAFDRRGEASSNETRRAYLELRAAHAFRAAGRSAEALEAATRALAAPDSIVDEFGTPIAYYAVGLLSALEKDLPGTIERRLASPPAGWLTPGALNLLAGLTSIDSTVAGEHALLESLRRRPLVVDPAPGSPRWIVDESSTWLIRLVDGGRVDAERITAISVDSLRSLLPPDAPLRIAPAAGIAGGILLGAPFRGLWADVTLPRDGRVLRRFVPIAGVFLFLVLAMLAGFLLWRDVRRESRLSALRSQFVSSVSHELRTPLTSIRLYAESMRAFGGDDPEERDQDLAVIANESERLTRMLDNVLNTSRIEKGTMRYRFELADVSEPVNRASRSMGYVFAQSEIDLNITSESIFTTIDPDAVEQAVINLLSNAMKYGEGRPVDLRCFRENGHARIDVTDRGPGLSRQAMERIFERFHREDSVIRSNIPGAGLGLSLVQHIMEAHGGSVDVSSSSASGTTFTLAFPIRES